MGLQPNLLNATDSCLWSINAGNFNTRKVFTNEAI
nr:MAG TPA: hypothetical protein [Caudoviricetes sp.]